MKAADFFTAAEIDVLGETFNISLGSSAKAINLLLDKVVNITAPEVQVMRGEDFHFDGMEKALAVDINYVKGLSGRNLMLLKKEDVRKILEIMMMMELDPETFEIDEMGESAVCEMMNQMMGSAATAMSDFLNMVVDISTPTAIPIENELLFKRTYFEKGEFIVVVKFNIEIGDTLSSEFFNIMKYDFAHELLDFVEKARQKDQA